MIKYGKDSLEEMQKLETQSIDICLTDFPFNTKFKGTKQKNGKEIYYKDNMHIDDYIQWVFLIFQEIKRITKGQVIFPGNKNLDIWYKMEKPKDLIIHYSPNRQSISSMAYLGKYDAILFYGEFTNKLPMNVIKKNIKNGKNREMPSGVHPCPGCYEVYYHILKHLKPSSVLDPFLGSGTTAQACRSLKIPIIGFEINKKYERDFHYRMNQRTLLKYCT